MIQHFNIAGYCRISVDEELDRDNMSIENQKNIIKKFVKDTFPNSSLTFYEDRDRSGYTFQQRDGYQAMRRELMNHQYDILVVKDFSRFSRRNSRGLVELEDLRDVGIRIISIGDGIDFPNDNDWLKIQFQFLLNEVPVTDTSKKVKSVVKRRQEEGEWICAAPYGYITNKQKQFEIVPTEADIIRQIFQLYIDGWGYKRIANHLTDQGIPTPRMSERDRKESAGEEYHRKVKPTWSITTIQGILDNDFYIGTLRQGKYTRKKINGADIKQEEDKHLIFEHHHQAILDYRTFAIARAQREDRSRNNYRGVKQRDHIYSGFLFCGDCGSPMFSMSRNNQADAYRCGTYHRRGLKGCTSHFIRADKLDELIKLYVRKVKDHSTSMLEQLNADLKRETEDIQETERASENLTQILEQLQEELKATKRQRIRDLMKHPDQEALIEETYDDLETELAQKIHGIKHQIDLSTDKRNTIIRVNRVAKTALDVFDDILNKKTLERNDLILMVEKIIVFEDHIELQLKADIDQIIRCDTLQDEENCAINFKHGTKDAIVQSIPHRTDKVFRVDVISDGDPLEIYTDKDGEVIFKKYSMLSGLNEFANQICETIHKTVHQPALITDRDSIIALAGLVRREWVEKPISPALENILESRQLYRHQTGAAPFLVTESKSGLFVSLAAPIIAQGDVLGSILLWESVRSWPPGETSRSLLVTISGFLGRLMEG